MRIGVVFSFFAGSLTTAAILSVPALADNVIVKCQPVFQHRCEEPLAMYFKYGPIPNRCKVT